MRSTTGIRHAKHISIRLMALGAALVAFALSASLASASSTVAASPHAAAGSAALNLPYDGTDPIATGCANSAETVASKEVVLDGQDVGDLQLRWSTTCKTNWGRFIDNSSGRWVDVYVYRQADNQWCGDQPGKGCNPGWWNASSVYSNQLYGCGYRTLAEVFVYDGPGDPLDGGPSVVYATPLVGGC